MTYVTPPGTSYNRQTACLEILATRCTIAVNQTLHPPGTQFSIGITANTVHWSSSVAHTTVKTGSLSVGHIFHLYALGEQFL